MVWSLRIARGALAAAAGVHLGLVAWVFASRIDWPLDLEWMEGGMLAHALRVTLGAPIYGPPSIDFIPYLYTPLYPWVLAALGGLFELSYTLGRSVSIASFAVLLVLVYTAARAEGVDRIWSFAACGAIAACFPRVDGFYDLVRADSLFLALLLGGLRLLRDRYESRAGVVAAGMLLALAFLAKQTAAPFIVAAPVALVFLAPRKIPLLVAVVAVVDGGTTLWLDARTAGWFWKTIFELHQSHSFDRDRFLYGAALHLLRTLPVVVGMLPAWIAVAAISRRASAGACYWALMAGVGVVASALSWSTQWASHNAFLPGFVFTSLFAAVAVADLSRRLRPGAGLRLVASLSAAAVALQLVALRWDPREHVPTEADRARADRFLAELADLAREGDLLIPYHPWYPTLVGRPSHLHQMGIRDFRRGGVPPPEALARAVDEGRYAAILLDGRPDPAYGPLRERYRQALLADAPWTFEGFRVRPRTIWRPRTRPRPLVVVYVVDTLRADHLSVYGYERDTSPALVELARDAVVFENAFAPAAWTKPSIASLLSGLHPARHGAIGRSHRLSAELPSLPETLREAGYETAAFVSNPNLLPVFGFDRGFDHFVDVESVAKTATARDVLDAALAFLATRRAGPLFLYIHTRDPHFPYAPPEPEAHRFDPPSPGDDNLAAIARYDGEIAYGDRYFGEFRERLRGLGLYDGAVLVFASDHGEEFRDHGGRLHGHSLYRELLHVPLILKLPKQQRAGARIDEPVELLDVFPTILEVLGIDPPAGLDGRSLLPLLNSEPLPRVELFAEQDLDRNTLTSLTAGSYKLIERTRPRRSLELFDVERDPLERTNLATERPDLVLDMQKRLQRVRARLAGGTHVTVVNGPGASESTVLRGRVVIRDGRLGEWTPVQLEADDRVWAGDDGTSLLFEMRLRNEENPIQQNPRILRDVDGFRLHTQPADATLEVSLEGDPLPVALGLGPARAVALPLRVRGSDVRLRAPHAPPPPGPGGPRHLRVYHLREVESESVAIDADLDRRLRALGYAEGEPD